MWGVFLDLSTISFIYWRLLATCKVLPAVTRSDRHAILTAFSLAICLECSYFWSSFCSPITVSAHIYVCVCMALKPRNKLWSLQNSGGLIFPRPRCTWKINVYFLLRTSHLNKLPLFRIHRNPVIISSQIWIFSGWACSSAALLSTPQWLIYSQVCVNRWPRCHSELLQSEFDIHTHSPAGMHVVRTAGVNDRQTICRDVFCAIHQNISKTAKPQLRLFIDTGRKLPAIIKNGREFPRIVEKRH